jgi:hypothetical protein
MLNLRSNRSYRVSEPVHPGHEAHHGRGRAAPHAVCEPQRGAGDEEVVVDGEDGVRGELPDGPEPVVEAVPLVDNEPHIAAAPGGADDALAQRLRRLRRLAPHDVDGVDARAGGVVRDGPPQERVALPGVDHHREAAAGPASVSERDKWGEWRGGVGPYRGEEEAAASYVAARWSERPRASVVARTRRQRTRQAACRSGSGWRRPRKARPCLLSAAACSWNSSLVIGGGMGRNQQGAGRRPALWRYGACSAAVPYSTRVAELHKQTTYLVFCQLVGGFRTYVLSTVGIIKIHVDTHKKIIAIWGGGLLSGRARRWPRWAVPRHVPSSDTARSTPTPSRSQPRRCYRRPLSSRASSRPWTCAMVAPTSWRLTPPLPSSSSPFRVDALV